MENIENKDTNELKMNRKEQREEIIKRLYEMDINRDFSECESEYEFIAETLEGVSIHLDKIDDIIAGNLTNWKINRLTYVDRSIIRLAVYEMYYTSIPAEIIINEALNNTRKYSDDGDNKMVGFTNKVLDNIKVFLKK